jgi:ABC-type cobalamin/Fe3+-siderophores transport system ATPase subunit
LEVLIYLKRLLFEELEIELVSLGKNGAGKSTMLKMLAKILLLTQV